MINKIKEIHLRKILLILLIILVLFFIIKECKIIGFCCSIINILSPLFWGYIIAWLLKPLMLKINKRFNLNISILLSYFIICIIIGFLGYLLVPIIIKEIKNLVPEIVYFYHRLPSKVLNNINLNELAKKGISMINGITTNTKNIVLNIFYSFFISYFYLISHKEVTKKISKYIPSKLTKEISINMRLFVKGTLIDTLLLFLMTMICFYIFKMPYALLFALVISLTNIIPYIGPYIGGIPAVLVAFSTSSKLGITILITVIVLQFIESSIIHPIIMSKSLNISPLYILIGLIIFGYFFGILGMLISTPLVSIIISCYNYFKKNKKSYASSWYIVSSNS